MCRKVSFEGSVNSDKRLLFIENVDSTTTNQNPVVFWNIYQETNSSEAMLNYTANIIFLAISQSSEIEPMLSNDKLFRNK